MSALIRVALSHKELQIEPGQKGELAVTIQNLSEIVDQYSIEIDGLSPGWYTVPVSEVSLFPQDQDKVRISLHPPAGSESKGGNYDFSVRVASREMSTERTSVQATLVMLSIIAFEVGLSPERKSTTKEGVFEVRLANLGNVDLLVDLQATDAEEGCYYRFEPRSVSIGAGQSKRVPLVVMPKKGPPRGEVKRYDFTVKATPREAPTQAKVVTGQLEHQERKPLLPSWFMPAAVIAVLLLFCCAISVAGVAIFGEDLEDLITGWATPHVDPWATMMAHATQTAIAATQTAEAMPGAATPTAMEVPPEATPLPTEPPEATPEPTEPAPPPDLSVSGLAISPEVPITGTPFRVQAILHNEGIQSLSNVTVRVETHMVTPHARCSDPGVVLYETTENLDAGHPLPVDYSVPIDSGGHHLICVEIDPTNAIAESDEDNNSQGQEIAVGILTTIPLDADKSGSVDANRDIYPYAQPGDFTSDQQVKGFLSWDIWSYVPDGTDVVSAYVTWTTHCFHGGSAGSCTGARDPFPTLGRLWVRAYYYGDLDDFDFHMAGTEGGILLTSYTAQPTGQLDVLERVLDVNRPFDPFQLYLLFENDTDNNGYADGVRFQEGSGEDTLTVVYVPG